MAKSLYDALHVEDPEFPDQQVAELDPQMKLTGKSFCRAIVESTEYRQSIVRRILADKLPAAVECKILDHAIGVPKQRVEMDDKRVTNPYLGLSEAAAFKLHGERQALIVKALTAKPTGTNKVH